MNKYIVKKMRTDSPQWGVYAKSGALMEGGFFSRAAAQRCADSYDKSAA